MLSLHQIDSQKKSDNIWMDKTIQSMKGRCFNDN